MSALARQGAKLFAPIIARLPLPVLAKLLAIVGKVAVNQSARVTASELASGFHDGTVNGRFMSRVFSITNTRCRTGLINFVLNSAARDDAPRLIPEGEVPKPFLFAISPTQRCNLRCTGCWASEYERYDELDTRLINRLMREAEELGMCAVTVLGGEPFIRRDMEQVYARHKDILFMPFTNGTLIDREQADRLGKIGNVLPMLSLEGFEEDTDARRGKGVFRKVMQAMDNLREAGVPFGFSATITKYNMDTIIGDKFNDMLIEKGCLIGWHLLYLPEGRSPNPDLMPTPEQRVRLRREGAARIRTQKPMFILDLWNDGHFNMGCIAAGRHYFHVNAAGNVEPCNFLHFAKDNVKDKSLKEILTSPFFTQLRAKQAFNCGSSCYCFILDYPENLRSVFDSCHPFPTHPGAETLVSDPGLCSCLDKYSRQIRELDAQYRAKYGSTLMDLWTRPTAAAENGRRNKQASQRTDKQTPRVASK